MLTPKYQMAVIGKKCDKAKTVNFLIGYKNARMYNKHSARKKLGRLKNKQNFIL